VVIILQTEKHPLYISLQGRRCQQIFSNWLECREHGLTFFPEKVGSLLILGEETDLPVLSHTSQVRSEWSQQGQLTAASIVANKEMCNLIILIRDARIIDPQSLLADYRPFCR